MKRPFPYVDAEGIRAAAYGMDIPSDADESIDRLISKAGERLKVKVPGLENRVEAGAITPELVQGVIEDMVLRVVRNPYGFAQEQAGEFMYRIDRVVASGAIQVTEEDIALLTHPGSAFGTVNVNVPRKRYPYGRV